MGVENLLSNNGIFILEVPHLFNIIKYNQYDNIFHEHLGFHSLKSIKDLCDKNRLKIFKVERIPSQGGSLRCFICKKINSRKSSLMIRKILNLELQSQLFSSKNLENFGKKITKHSEKLYNFLKN